MLEATRRSVLKGAACGIMAAGVLAGTAVADEAMDPLAPFAEIDESQIAETVECDVAVVGLGLAGVAAMRVAAEGGSGVRLDS